MGTLKISPLKEVISQTTGEDCLQPNIQNNERCGIYPQFIFITMKCVSITSSHLNEGLV